MPLNQTLMDELVARYGKDKGELIYWGMAGEGKGPFGPKGKYRREHETTAARAGGAPTQGKKKAPAHKGRGPAPQSRRSKKVRR